MPFGRGGRGYRWMYYATGMPGWMRYSYIPQTAGGRIQASVPVWGFGRGNPYPYCRFFPWLPRGWWTGMYGQVEWTEQGPIIKGMEEIDALRAELKRLEDEKRYIEQEINNLRKRLEEGKEGEK